ncbi:MAG: IS4 family transposase [Thermoplasmata archaeon]
MTKYSPCIVEETLCKMFSQEWLRKTAEETNLVKRERKIDPVIMFWVLTLSFGVRLQRNLASLKRSYEREGNTTISYSSWYERFTPELVDFLHTCVIHGIEHLAQEPGRKLKDKLNVFKDLLIKDSTIVRLHSTLADIYPAARTRKIAAGIKVSLLVSAVTNGPKHVALYSERTGEVKTLKLGKWVKDRILLLDLGYFKYHLFVRIVENGGSFVSRLKSNANPLIVGVNQQWRGNSVDVVGKKLKDVLPKLKRGVLDVEVEIEFKRRKYRGKSRKDTKRFRLVAVLNKEEKKYHIYLTDISTDILCAEDIAKLYSARWDVELIFKELKSKYALDVVNTTNPQVIEAYIWVAILTLLVSRRIYNLVRDQNPERDIVRFTQLRWSNTFAEMANDQLTTILEYCGIKRTFETVMGVYDSQALDPHVNRDRFMDYWRA